MVQILKAERNRRIYQLRKEDPKRWTYKRLAREFNISFPRVQQICNEWPQRVIHNPQLEPVA